MQIKELTIQAFTLFASNSPLKNYMQTEEYARLMGEYKFNYDYIGLVDDSGTILAASLILYRKIGLTTRFGYAPKGFLVNYYNEKLIHTFSNLLKEYYKKKNFAFIKINPEIVVATINPKTYVFKDNPNMQLKIDIQRHGFNKLKDNIYFESINPRFNAYVNLKNSNIKKYNKATRNKISNSKRKGLYFEIGSDGDIDVLKSKNLLKYSTNYYKTLYNIFSNNDMIDLFLVRVNYENYVIESQKAYEKETNDNTLFNEILHRSNKVSDLNKKMNSDQRLTSIKNDIIRATDGLKELQNEIVAFAIVVKYDNRVHIIESNFDRSKTYLNANYYLYSEIINHYKEKYAYLDLGGITGDFKKSNPYYTYNRFILGFNPDIYEYIGEFDLIIQRTTYDYLLNTGKLAHEFNGKDFLK